MVARSVGAMLAHCAPCGGLGLSVGTYAPTSSFRISAVSLLPGNPSPVGPHPPADVHAPCAAPAVSHRVAVASTSSAPPQPLNWNRERGPTQRRDSSSPRAPAMVMSLPSGEVCPLRPSVTRDMVPTPVHVATNAELGLCEPLGEVTLLDCERYTPPTRGGTIPLLQTRGSAVSNPWTRFIRCIHTYYTYLSGVILLFHSVTHRAHADKRRR